jgi:hypothetical protein
LSSNSFIYNFSDTANGDVNVFLLDSEIRSSSITADLSHVLVTGQDSFAVVFLTNLTAQEAQELDSLVALHEGESPVQVQTVQLQNITKGFGIPKVAIYEAEGMFSSYVTHDFTDNTTWSATNDSSFTIEPSAGNVMRLKRAEVQFSKDIAL